MVLTHADGDIVTPRLEEGFPFPSVKMGEDDGLMLVVGFTWKLHFWFEYFECFEIVALYKIILDNIVEFVVEIAELVWMMFTLNWFFSLQLEKMKYWILLDCRLYSFGFRFLSISGNSRINFGTNLFWWLRFSDHIKILKIIITDLFIILCWLQYSYWFFHQIRLLAIPMNKWCI